MQSRRTLYPPVEPYRTGRLRVSNVHELHWEESGHPEGKPVVFVHGGPGAGTTPQQRRYFDPARYRIVLFDQRGCGKSTPHAALEENTTWHLVDDMEALRVELGIDRWQVFGGSWGSTLGIAYAQRHPDRVSELVLRGIFLFRQSEIDWLYRRGANAVFADAWEEFVAPIPESDRGDVLGAYHRRLTSDDPAVRSEAARAWSIWEARVAYLLPNEDLVSRASGDTFALSMARIECHYVMNSGFFADDSGLLDGVDRIRRIPGVIVQGRYDMVCPVETAWALHRAWPEADLRIVPDAGHGAFEPGVVHELVEATDRFAVMR